MTVLCADVKCTMKSFHNVMAVNSFVRAPSIFRVLRILVTFLVVFFFTACYKTNVLLVWRWSGAAFLRK